VPVQARSEKDACALSVTPAIALSAGAAVEPAYVQRRHQVGTRSVFAPIAKNKDSAPVPPESESRHTTAPPSGGSIVPPAMMMTP